MSHPPPSSPVPSGYPPAQPPLPRKYRPRWAWFLVGAGLIVVGALLGIGLFVWALWPFFSTAARIEADGQTHQVSVDTDGERMLWRERGVFDPACLIVDTATGEEVDLDPVTSQMTRDTGDGEFVAAYRFDPGSGRLEVTCGAEAGDADSTVSWGQEVAIGPAPQVGSLVGGILAGIAVPAFLGLLGLATLVVTGILWASRPPRPKG